MSENITNTIPEVEEYIETLKHEVELGSKSSNTFRSYIKPISDILTHFDIKSIKDLDNLTAKNLRDYRNTFIGVKISTINARFRVLNVFFNWLVDVEYISKNPLEKLKSLDEPKKLPVVLTDQECDDMVKACEDNDFLKITIVLLLSTGMRREELANIKVTDIFDEHIYINGKGNKERAIPLQKSVYDYLMDYIKKYDITDYIIVSERGKHGVDGESIRLRVKKIAEKAGIDEKRLAKISTHTMRRTFATSLLSEGVDSMVIQSALGHASITTTRKYAQTVSKVMDREILKNQRSIL